MKTLLKFLSLFLILLFANCTKAEIKSGHKINLQKSVWVHQNRDGKLIYKHTAKGDRIMDYSYAGYMGGGVAIPVIPVLKIVNPSKNGDASKLIQDAIDSVSIMPLQNGFRGTVLLSPGIFTCSKTINISKSGVVLRGSGSGIDGSIIKMTGDRHTAIVLGFGRNRQSDLKVMTGSHNREGSDLTKTIISDIYVPSGSITFTVDDTKGFSIGDNIEIYKPVTEAWLKFMQMDNLKRDGRPQTWIRTGTSIITQRTIAAIDGNKITLDIPLSDSFDSKFLNPPGTIIIKTNPSELIEQAGVEHLHIQAPPMEMSYEKAPYSALRINGKDCWAQDIFIEETMNSVAVTGNRITLTMVNITRTVPNLGASKPAEFAPSAGQVLLDRCSSYGDNIWHVATGGGQAGPIVLLNCTFGGKGHIEGHQRWTTGMLLDNCYTPEGGIDFKNRGAMGSGHGWGIGWAVAWNCVAKSFVVQQPPGAFNWMIGCIGKNVPTARPFDTSPTLPLGISDSPGKPVTPQSLYLSQLLERLGPQALKNIGYSSSEPENIFDRPNIIPSRIKPIVDSILGTDVAAHKLANTSNVRNGNPKFGGERALDGDPNTYWTTDDSVANATLELDLEDPQIINLVELREASGFENRVEDYKVEGQVDSDWKLLAHGSTIGKRKIDRFTSVTAWKVRLTILKASASPAISTFGLYRVKNSTLK